MKALIFDGSPELKRILDHFIANRQGLIKGK